LPTPSICSNIRHYWWTELETTKTSDWHIQINNNREWSEYFKCFIRLWIRISTGSIWLHRINIFDHLNLHRWTN
jgi:hypothetical protein